MSDGAYADATVKSSLETERAFSPLALELADKIKALPKFCDRADIAEMIDPYLKAAAGGELLCHVMSK